MEEIIKYIENDLEGIQETSITDELKKQVNCCASFNETASNVYDYSIKKVESGCNDEDKETLAYIYTKYNKNDLKRCMVDSIKLLVKFYVNILLSAVDNEYNSPTTDYGYSDIYRNAGTYIKKIFSHSDAIWLALSPQTYNKESFKRFYVNKTYKTLLTELIPYRACSDLLKADYKDEISLEYANDIYSKLCKNIISSGEKSSLQIYFFNRHFMYPLAEFFHKCCLYYDKRFNVIIKAFNKFGYQDIFVDGYNTIMPLIVKHSLYGRCIDLMSKYELNKGYTIIGFQAEKYFRNVSTIQNYIDRLGRNERKWLRDIEQCNSIDDVQINRQEIDSLINDECKAILFIFSLAEYMSTLVMKLLLNTVNSISVDEDKVEYLRVFYQGISISTPTEYINQYNKTLDSLPIISKNQSLISWYKKPIEKSLSYFKDLYYYMKKLYLKKPIYAEIKKNSLNEEYIRNMSRVFKIFSELKQGDDFKKFATMINFIDEKPVEEYYIELYAFFSQYHSNITNALGYLATARKYIKKSGNSKLKSLYKTLISLNNGTDKTAVDLFHYFCQFRRKYKFAFENEPSLLSSVQELKNIW